MENNIKLLNLTYRYSIIIITVRSYANYNKNSKYVKIPKTNAGGRENVNF